MRTLIKPESHVWGWLSMTTNNTWVILSSWQIHLDDAEEKDKTIQMLKKEWFIQWIKEEEVTGDIILLWAK